MSGKCVSRLLRKIGYPTLCKEKGQKGNVNKMDLSAGYEN